MIPLWQSLKTYLNESLHNNEKKRKDILLELEQRISIISPFISYGRFQDHRFQISTVDTYLNYLHKAGYLYKPRYGTYGLAKEIESDLSVSDVKNVAYGEIFKFDDEDTEIGGFKFDKSTRTIKYVPKKEFFKKEEFAI